MKCRVNLFAGEPLDFSKYDQTGNENTYIEDYWIVLDKILDSEETVDESLDVNQNGVAMAEDLCTDACRIAIILYRHERDYENSLSCLYSIVMFFKKYFDKNLPLTQNLLTFENGLVECGHRCI